MLRFLTTLSAATLLVCADVSAEKPVEGAAQTDFFDELWRSVELYGDRGGEALPFVKFRGRYHGQAYWADGDGGNEHDWENRRIRLGLDFVLSEKLEIAFDFNMGRESDDDVIENFDFVSLNVALSDNTALSIGKLRRNPLTREDSISSNKILTLERSLLTSRFFVDNVGGIFVVHQDGDWAFGAGILEGSTEDELGLPSLDGATMFKGNIARQVSDATEVRFDYLYNPGDADNNDVEPYRHVVSLNSYTRSGRWGLITDIIYADGLPEARGDLYGVVVLPHLMLTDRLQLVGRYTWSGSSEDSGIRLSNRYERRVVAEGFELGDQHQAVYAGLNYYFYGHKLKLVSGVEYTDFDSIGGSTSILTGSVALRLYF
ncbi:MAG: porin [Pseudomonadota bacterium]